MTSILSIHSYRGGTGKSNVSANLGYLAARAGRRVAVLDTDLQSPGVHVLFGFKKERMAHTLSDFLFGKCDMEDAAYDLSGELGIEAPGALFLLPSSLTVDAIMRILKEGYDADMLNRHFSRLGESLKLDLLVVDSHPGLNRETMLTTAVSEALVLLIRPDNQDFHGTAVLVEVAGRLGVPHVHMVANKVVSSLDHQDVKRKIRDAFGYEVIGILPLDEEMASFGSRGIFAREFPDHRIATELQRICGRILEDLDRRDGDRA